MLKPAISIIIPVYNVEKYLRKCVDSVIGQTLKNIEIILVDDGSSDNSGKICDQYLRKDKRIKVIHKKNGGISSARNAGIEKASADYICFLDSDDFVRPNAYETLHNLIVDNCADLVICDYQRFENEKEIEDEDFSKLELTIFNKNEATLKLLNDTSKSAVFICATNRIYKRSIFEDIRFPVGYICEDEMLAPDIFMQCEKVIYCNKALLCYRETPGSISRTNSLTRYAHTVKAFSYRVRLFNKIGNNLFVQIAATTYTKYFFTCFYNILKNQINEKIDKDEMVREKYLKDLKKEFKELLPILLNKNNRDTILMRISYILFDINTYLFLAFNRLFKVFSL